MTIQDQLLALVTPVVDQLELDLVELAWVTEAGRRILRITIDRPGGISHEHCEKLSRALDPLLDEAMPDERYHLEVSSPGAERPLKTDADFARFAGRRVYVYSRELVLRRHEWRGILKGADSSVIILDTDAGEVRIPREAVAKARLSID